MWWTSGPVRTRSQVPSHLRLIHAISTVESMEIGAYHFTQGPKSLVPKYDTDAYTTTPFGGETWDLLGVGLSRNLDPSV
jgi:hypothetical protein